MHGNPNQRFTLGSWLWNWTELIYWYSNLTVCMISSRLIIPVLTEIASPTQVECALSFWERISPWTEKVIHKRWYENVIFSNFSYIVMSKLSSNAYKPKNQYAMVQVGAQNEITVRQAGFTQQRNVRRNTDRTWDFNDCWNSRNTNVVVLGLQTDDHLDCTRPVAVKKNSGESEHRKHHRSTWKQLTKK